MSVWKRSIAIIVCIALVLTSQNFSFLVYAGGPAGSEQYHLSSQNNSVFESIKGKTSALAENKISEVSIQWDSNYYYEDDEWVQIYEDVDPMASATKVTVKYLKNGEERTEGFFIQKQGQLLENDEYEQAEDGYSILNDIPDVASIQFQSKGTIHLIKSEENWNCSYMTNMDLDSIGLFDGAIQEKLKNDEVSDIQVYWVTKLLEKSDDSWFHPVADDMEGFQVTVVSIEYLKDGNVHYENIFTWEEDGEIHCKANASIKEDGSLNYEYYDEDVIQSAITYGDGDTECYLAMPEDEYSIFSVLRPFGDMEWKGEGFLTKIAALEETEGADLENKDVKVLVVYPKDNNIERNIEDFITKNPLPSGFSLEFDSVAIEDFNKEPDIYLKNEQGDYQYDLVTVGVSDANSKKDISGKARCSLKQYVNAGYGFLIGHDTICANSYGVSPVAEKKGIYADDSEVTPVNDNHWNMNDVFLTCARIKTLETYMQVGDSTVSNSPISNMLKIEKEGPITSFPYDLGNRDSILIDGAQYKTLDAYQAHSYQEFAYGDVWVSFTSKSGSMSNVRTSFEGKTGTNNFYLTTSGNVGMSQMGHSDDKFTDDEMKLYINTVFYLSQPQRCKICNDGKTNARIVRDAEHFKSLVEEDPTGCFILGDDICLPPDWAPIANFRGHFSTNDYEITFAEGLAQENRKLFENNRRVVVTVTDEENHPLQYVSVVLKGKKSYNLVTDEFGRIEVPDAAVGTYHLMVNDDATDKTVSVSDEVMDSPIFVKEEKAGAVKLSFYSNETKRKLIKEFYTLPDCEFATPICEGEQDYDFLYWSNGRKAFEANKKIAAPEEDMSYIGVWKYTGLSSINDLVVSKTTATEAHLFWGESPEAEEVVGYLIIRDGKVIGTVSDSSYIDTGLTPETTYEYQIKAVNAENKYSRDGNKLMVTTTKDTDCPTAPTSISVVDASGSRIELNFLGATDNVGVTGYKIYRDKEEIATVTGTNTWTDTNVTVGKSVIYTVKAMDAAGNCSELSQPCIGRAENPSVRSVSPAAYSFLGGQKADLSVVIKKVGKGKNVTVKAEYTDDLESGIYITIGEKTASDRNSTEQSAAFVWDISELSSGTCWIRYTVTDADGNTIIETVEYTLDKDGPIAPANVQARTIDGMVLFSWEPSISGDTKVYHVYKRHGILGDFTEIASVREGTNYYYEDVNVIENETYYYKIVAEDMFGQMGLESTEAEILVSTDGKTPEITSITPKDGRINQKANISVCATDNIKLHDIALYYSNEKDGEWNLVQTIETVFRADFTFDTKDCSDGTIYIKAIATDASGNSKEITKEYVVDNTGIGKIEITDFERKATYVKFAWKQPVEDDFGYFYIEQKIDGEFKNVKKVGTVLGEYVTGLDPEETYVFRVVGYDDLGNRGVPSDEVEIGVAEDETAPNISYFGPASSHYNRLINLKITAEDDVQVGKLIISYSRDKKDWKTLAQLVPDKKEKTSHFQYPWNIEDEEEGTVYVKAEAFDKTGNSSLEYGEVVTSFEIDRTPPESSTSLSSTTSGGTVRLEWQKGGEKDLASYNVYRAEKGSEDYKKVESGLTYLSYLDRDVQQNETFCYKITAVDWAGNESDFSNVVMIQVSYDATPPKFYAIAPKDNQTVGKNTEVKFVCADDRMLKTITAEYQQVSGDSSVWRPLKTFQYNESSTQSSFVWENEHLSCGDYRIRLIATDVSNNVSLPYIVTYTLDNTPPAKPVVKLTEENWKITLSWDSYNDKRCQGFKIFRKKDFGDYELIKTISSYQYIDEDVEPGYLYTYKVVAGDAYGNTSQSSECSGTPGEDDVIKPVAICTEMASGIEGKEIVFDGTQSKDNVKVVSYTWDMGNGDKLSGGKIRYAYDKEGDYTATLTVADAKGNTAKQEIAVHILKKSSAGVANFIITDWNNRPLSYACIYIKIDDTRHKCYDSDADGKLTIALEDGTYTIAAYKTGYLPVESELVVHAYGEVDKKVQLEEGELVTANWEIKKLNFDEILSRGIDILDPANYHTFTMKLELTFKQEPTPVTEEWLYDGLDVNAFDSGFGGGGFGGGGGGGDSTGSGRKDKAKTYFETHSIKQIDDSVPIYAVLTRTESISWLKDFYDVTLQVINNADEQFKIINSKAELTVPDGLYLAKTNTENDACRNLGEIPGKQSKKVTWCLRGDRIGDYNLSADFTGTLMPFEKQVNVTFKSEETLKVTAGQGLHLFVYPEKTAYVGEKYYVQYRLLNESDHSFYNVSTTFVDTKMPLKEERKYYYKDGKLQPGRTQTTLPDTGEPQYYEFPADRENIISPCVENNSCIRVKELKPGTCIVGTYVTDFEDSEHEVKDSAAVVYELVKQTALDLSEYNTGLTVSVIPIEGHLSIERRNTISFDPIDLSTGAFTEEHSLLNTVGVVPLDLGINYRSTNTNGKGIFGRGWNSDYEMYLTDENGVVNIHWNPERQTGFIPDFIAKNGINADYSDGVFKLNPDENLENIHYTCLDANISSYDLSKDAKGYELKMPDQTVYYFTLDGKLAEIRNRTNQVKKIQYGEERIMVSDPVTGQHIDMFLGEDGLVEKASDNAGNEVLFTYENDCLTKIVDKDGQKISYEYDDNAKIIKGFDNDDKLFVENTYDEMGRVLTQDDNNEETPLVKITYEQDEVTKNLTVHSYNKNGSEDMVVVDGMGNQLEYHDQSGFITKYEYDDAGHITKEIKPDGCETTYEYDEKFRVIKESTNQGKVTTKEYDDNGNIVKETSSDGANNQYTYNEHNQLTSVQYASGMKVDYTYNDAGQKLTETTEGIGTIKNTYENGFLTKKVDPYGREEYFSYDALGNTVFHKEVNGTIHNYTLSKTGKVLEEELTSEKHEGYKTKYEYDQSGNVIKKTNANGACYQYEYSPENYVTKEIDPMGACTTFERNMEGLVTKIHYPGEKDKVDSSMVYDAAGNLLSVKNELGGIKTYEYLAPEVVTSTKDEIGGEIKYEYYDNGLLKKEISSDGNEKNYTYDENGRILEIKESTGKVTKYGYNEVGNTAYIEDSRGGRTSYEYDIYNHIAKEIDKNGNATIYQCDMFGNVTKETDALGNVTCYEYDGCDNITKTTRISKDGGEPVVTTNEYDINGKVVKRTDGKGTIFLADYDSVGNMIHAYDGEGNIISTCNYDDNGNCISVTDANGVVTEYTYDQRKNLETTLLHTSEGKKTISVNAYKGLDTLTSSQNASGDLSKYTVDEKGNITSITNPNGGVTEFTYDENGNLTKADVKGISLNNYKYGLDNRLLEKVNGRNQKTTYEYDTEGNLIEMKDDLGSVSYTYDLNGNMTSVKDANGTILMKYDELNRMISCTDTAGNTITYTYEGFDQLKALTYPDGRKVTYSYDENNKITTVTDWKGRVTQYEYDKNGNVVAIENPSGIVQSYEYDKTGKLGKLEEKKEEKILQSIQYEYSEDGNVVKTTALESSIGGIKSTSSAVMTYSDNNLLLTYNGEAVKYDADGNMIYGPLNGKMQDFTYDCRNRVTKAGTTFYEYDALNNRIAKVEDGITTQYVTDLNSRMGRILVTETKGKQTNYIYGDRLLAQESEELGYLDYHFNHVGSTTALTDENGTIKYRYGYDAYGHLTQGTIVDGICFLFNGRYGVVTDKNGLYYMKTRCYNVDIKRFINQDTVLGTIDNSSSLNRYAFAEGNPINGVDPFGQATKMLDIVNQICSTICFTCSLMSLAGGIAGSIFGAGLPALFSMLNTAIAIGSTLMQMETESIRAQINAINAENYRQNGDEEGWYKMKYELYCSKVNMIESTVSLGMTFAGGTATYRGFLGMDSGVFYQTEQILGTWGDVYTVYDYSVKGEDVVTAYLKANAKNRLEKSTQKKMNRDLLKLDAVIDYQRLICGRIAQ